MQETLTINHHEKVSHLVKILSDMEDGELVVGNGKEIIHHDIAPLKHSFVLELFINIYMYGFY